MATSPYLPIVFKKKGLGYIAENGFKIEHILIS
jgi:hypothetical protein